jgi:hypothetical protein
MPVLRYAGKTITGIKVAFVSFLLIDVGSGLHWLRSFSSVLSDGEPMYMM